MKAATFVMILVTAARALASTPPPHPRLYFTADELKQLRALREQGQHAVIYRNLISSADWCLTRPLRKEWIAPVSPDPIYENLYDRFFAIMHDMAVMEHLSFAWAYSEDPRYLQAARQWLLADAKIWQHEADGAPDASKAYAVTRMLKGVATAYDMLYDQLSEDERAQVCNVITIVGEKYYQWYLANPKMGTIEQGHHHASVETTSFGIAALAVLDEVPHSREWLDLMVKKHRESLLPHALAEDGAQIEGPTFWASTMQYRIAFMDALRRGTGEDLFTPFAANMDAKLALASIAVQKFDGPDQDHETVVFEPSYGQLNYYSPVLIALAHFYRNPLDQHLAQWDHTLGSIQQTRYITKRGEWLLFDWGGYAYAWCDESVKPAVPADAPLTFDFPSVHEKYWRESYQPSGIVAAKRGEQVIIHAGGRPVFVDLADPKPTQQTITLENHALTVTRETKDAQKWWCYGNVTRHGNKLSWPDGTALEITTGEIDSLDPQGYHDEKVVGMGKLRLEDPTPMTYPLITAKPKDGKLAITASKLAG